MQEDALYEGRQGRREIPNLFHIPVDTVREVSSFLRKTSGAFPTLESRASHRELGSKPTAGASSHSVLLSQIPMEREGGS